MNILPNGDSDTPPIVEGAAGGRRLPGHPVEQAGRPQRHRLRPLGHPPHLQRLESGKQIGDALVEAIGGSGGIIALQGILDTARRQGPLRRSRGVAGGQPGRRAARRADGQLLARRGARGDQDAAHQARRRRSRASGPPTTTWRSARSRRSRQAGQDGEVAVVGIDAVPDALTAIEDGTMTATVSSDGPWQGGIGLAIGYCVATGELDGRRHRRPRTARGSPSSS